MSSRTFYISLLLCLVLARAQAYASICDYLSPEKLVATSAVIFRGTVIAVEPKPIDPPMHTGSSRTPETSHPGSIFARRGTASTTTTIGFLGRQMVARFKIESLLKGRGNNEIEIEYEEPNGRNLGTRFSVDQSLTVFARRSWNGVLTTDGCMMHPYAEETYWASKPPPQPAYSNLPFARIIEQGTSESTAARSRTPIADVLNAYITQASTLRQRREKGHDLQSVLKEQAHFHMRYQDFEDAEIALSDLLGLQQTNASELSDRGNVRYALRRYDEALQDYREALSLDAGNLEAIRGQARALVLLERPGEIPPGLCDLTDFAAPHGHRGQFDFSGMDLRGAIFRNTNMTAPKFVSTNLGGVDFSRSRLSRADFSRANLVGAKFESMRVFYEANFDDARLDAASLKDSYLHRIDFGSANLAQVIFTGAKIDGVNFENARIAGGDWSAACFYDTRYSTVRWPKGFNKSKAGITECPVPDSLKSIRGLFGK